MKKIECYMGKKVYIDRLFITDKIKDVNYTLFEKTENNFLDLKDFTIYPEETDKDIKEQNRIANNYKCISVSDAAKVYSGPYFDGIYGELAELVDTTNKEFNQGKIFKKTKKK